jgi:hypothetical protein
MSSLPVGGNRLQNQLWRLTKMGMSDELGGLLVRRGLLTAEQCMTALAEERARGVRLATYVVEMGYVGEVQMAACIAEHLGLEVVSGHALEEVGRDALAYVPRELAEQYRMLPLSLQGNELHVCFADPQRFESLGDLGRLVGRTLRPFVATETALNDALERHYGIRPEVRLFREGAAPPASDHARKRARVEIERTGVFRAPPSLLEPKSTRPDPVELLAGAGTVNEVLRASMAYFVEIFASVIALGIHKGRAVTLVAGDRQELRPLAHPPELPLPDGCLLRAVLDRPHLAYRPTLSDTSLAGLCRSLGVPLTNITVVPAFDYGRPAFVLVGQGLDEKQVKQRFPEMKAFLAKVSQALRVVSLRAAIARR